MRVGRRTVRISNPDKVLFPDDGITKQDLAGYYAAVAPAMVPHVRDRPLNLWRWNAGIDSDVVVQQEIPKGAPEWVKRVEVPRRGAAAPSRTPSGASRRSSRSRNQNCITPHAWTARADRLGYPDRLVFDLDPPDEDARAHFPASARARSRSATLLREIGLRAVRDDVRLARPARRHAAAPPARTPTRRARRRASSPSCSPRAGPTS